jgi:hypothetical protein
MVTAVDQLRSMNSPLVSMTAVAIIAQTTSSRIKVRSWSPVLAARDARTGQWQVAAVVVMAAPAVEHIAVPCTRAKRGTR